MKARYFLKEISVSSLGALHNLLGTRHKSELGSFWFYHPSGTELSVMVNRQDAYVHFFPGDASAGYRPIGAEPDMWESFVEFLADNYESTPVPRAMVVPIERAILAVEEFYQSGAKPEALEWEQL